VKDFSSNPYERAFENWLIDNRVQYVAVDAYRKAALKHSRVKSFDFLVYPPNRDSLIVEIKGRKFKGASLAKLRGFECWVTTDDVTGLARWQEVFGPNHTAVFVFAYRMEKVDVDFDGRHSYDYDQSKYIFFAIKLSDYRKFMKRRSPKWQTVTLPADKFRKCAVQVQQLLSWDSQP
jgi:hypothetical protein